MRLDVVITTAQGKYSMSSMRPFCANAAVLVTDWNGGEYSLLKLLFHYHYARMARFFHPPIPS